VHHGIDILLIPHPAIRRHASRALAHVARLDDNHAAMQMQRRFLDLQTVLTEHQDLWRPQPFHGRELAWRARRPALAAAVDALSDDAVAALEASPSALSAWMAVQIPETGSLSALVSLPDLPTQPMAPAGTHFSWHIPGRKQAQIEAFAHHVIDPQGPLLEWCAGKGHLGRRLAVGHGQPVTSLEIDPALVEACTHLARRARIEQTPVCADALDPLSRQHVRGAHVVALHACGELHRTLVRHAHDDRARGYSIAPCCYHRWIDAAYVPLSPLADLPLDAAALRLAVTESVTAPGRERRALALSQAFKLGFVALREHTTGEGYRAFKPVPPAWVAEGFESFCRRLALREQVTLPERIDWAHWAGVGRRRQAEVARDSLVRHAFRRAIEVWLVGDLGLALEAAGFEVATGVFCERPLTPRNLLIQARR